MAQGILLDIEGTTTPISFVHDVLFPFARARLRESITRPDVEAFQAEFNSDVGSGLAPPPFEDPVHYVEWLMDRDRKSTALKALQGRIWQRGYASGVLRGEVFADVPPALRKWSERGVDVRIYSSGSVLAQKLLFSTTTFGDLTQFLKGYFDTTTGAKTDPASYASIATAFGLTAPDILFVSDLTRELDAASLAGLGTVLSRRPGNPSQPPHGYRSISTFQELFDEIH